MQRVSELEAAAIGKLISPPSLPLSLHTLTPIPGRYTLGPGDGNLTISPAMVADSSTLTCTAMNSADSVSDTAQLRVIRKYSLFLTLIL